MTQQLELQPPQSADRRPTVIAWTAIGVASSLMSAFAGALLGFWQSQGCSGFLCELGAIFIGGGLGYVLGAIAIVIVGWQVSSRSDDGIARGLSAFAGSVGAPAILIGVPWMLDVLGTVF